MSTRPPRPRLTGVVYEPAQAAEIVAELEARHVGAELLPCASEHSLAALLGKADFLVAVPFSSSLFQAAPQVRWLHSLSAGVEAWLEPPGPPPWPITRMTGLYESYIAEYVFAHLLYRSQELQLLRSAQSRREWIPRSEWMSTRTRTLRGQLMGVAGLGHIGREVARLGCALGMEVRGLRRQPDADLPMDLAPVHVYGLPEIGQFLAGLDVLVITLPLTEETRGLIGPAELSILGGASIVVNVARGLIVDDVALRGALVSERLGGAVLDTFSIEPLPHESPFWDMPTVTITPHMAGEASAAEVADICAPNIKSFLDGEIPGVLVDLRLGY
jgi:phosphoglycerate dehydrogenase-like enzyme